MYKNCREELLAVMRAFVIETGENEFSRAEAIAAMRRSGGKYPEGTVSAHLTYRCCANIPTRCYKPMYDDYEYTGRIITAEEAKLIGLVNQVTGDTREELMEAAKAMAEQIMKKGPVATRLAKMAINVGMDTDINTGLLFERIAQTVAFGTEDRKEGTQAFLEKRKAEFKGC